MATATLFDEEFGEIAVRYYSRSRSLRFRLTPKGAVTVSAPIRTPKIALNTAINTNRSVIRGIIKESRKDTIYDKNMPIGKSHRLVVVLSSLSSEPKIYTKDRIIYAHVVDADDTKAADNQRLIQKEVIKALRKEAKAYLPRRLKHLAERHGYNYGDTRLTHAGTRWGSCSSSGTISLNIALMKLEPELIDYVLLHELAHTKEMNHSREFWKQLETTDPNYRSHRRTIKNYSPAL